MLSATISEEQEKLIKEKLDIFTHNITMYQAILWGILPKPTVYLKIITPDKNYQNKIDYLNKQIKDFYEKGNYFMAKRKGLDRKLLFENIKMNWFEKESIFQRLKNKRCLFFLPDIKKSKELGNSVSSLENKKTNNKLLNDFNTEVVCYIISNRILVRGVNMIDVKWCYIGMIDLKGSSLIQSFSRVLLSTSSNILISCVAGTKEYDVLMKFFKTIKLEPKNI
jgi:superfamily II DNA or RNA helicase